MVATDHKKNSRKPGFVLWKHLAPTVKDLVMGAAGCLFGADPLKNMPKNEDVIARLKEGKVISSGSFSAGGAKSVLSLVLCCEGGEGKTVEVCVHQVACCLRDTGGKTRKRLSSYAQIGAVASI